MLPTKMIFPYQALPLNLQQVMWDVSNQTKAPPALIFTTIMAAIATASQDKHRVQRKDGLRSNISIYALCLALSGSRKSTVENIVFKPLHNVQAKIKVKHDEAMQTYKAAHQKWKLKGKVLEQKYLKELRNGYDDPVASNALAEHSREEPEEPACAKLFYTDATIEALLAGLSQHSRSSTLLDDEGGRILKGPLMRSAGQLCSLWDGDDIDVERKQAGSFSVVNPRISASILVQPEIFYNYYKRKGEEARASGLLARFLISEPMSTIGSRIDDNVNLPANTLEMFHDRLVNLYSKQEDVTLTFAPYAQVLWINHYNHIEQLMAPGGYLSELQDFGSKMPENTARLAALIHLSFDDGDRISYDTLMSAINVMNWYCAEAIHIFDAMGAPNQFMKDVAAFEAFMTRTHAMGLRYVRTKHILQNGPARLRKRAALNAVLEYLQMNGKCHWYFYGRTQYISLIQPAANAYYAPATPQLQYQVS